MSYLRYNLTGLLDQATALISLWVGLFVYSRDWGSRLHRSFFFITATGALWLAFFGMIGLVRNTDDAYPWLRLNYAVVPFISPCVYLFSLHWNNRPANRVSRIGFFIASFLGCLGPLMIKQIFYLGEFSGGRINYFRDSLVSNLFFIAVMGEFSGYAALAFRNFYQSLISAESAARRDQCRTFLIAAIVGYTGSVDFMVAQGLNIYPFGFLSFLTFVLLIAYAIVRYKFLNIDIFIRKFSLILLIYATLLCAMVPIAGAILHQFFGNLGDAFVRPLIGLGLFVGASLSLGPIIYAFIVRRNLWIRGSATASFTHELKSPLAAIQSAVDILQQQKTLPPEGDLAYLSMIEKNANRLSALVTNLLHVVQIQEEQISLNKTSFEFQALLNEEVTEHRATADTRQILIDLAPANPLMVDADREKIRHVLSNLLANAVKFSPNGSRVLISAKKEDRDLSCAVSDCGSGIPKALLKKVFDRFYSGPNSSKGTGLGLSIAKAWVEAHGGRIWAESEGEGKGTTMTFTLPVS